MSQDEKKKTIWIINQDASTPETGYGGRHYYFSEALARKGYNVTLVAASYHHLMHKQPKCTGRYSVERRAGFKVVWVKVGYYKKASSKGRVLNWFLFSWRLRGLCDQLDETPDTIVYSSPSLLGFVGAEHVANKVSAKLIFDVRDIWPLTLIQLGGYSNSHPFIKLLQWIEDRAYKNSDIVISNLSNSVQHMRDRGMDGKKFSWIPNGFSSDEASTPTPLSSEIVDKIPSDAFVVGYSGSIGTANANDVLLRAAAILKEHQDIYFVLVGAGEEKSSLVDYARKENLHNVVFIEPIQKKQIQSLLRYFSCCFFGVRDEAIYQFGIGANKIPEYMFSGKPIVMSYSGKDDPVSKSGAGITVPADDHGKLAAAILKINSLPDDEKNKMGIRGREFAFDNYDYSRIVCELEKLL